MKIQHEETETKGAFARSVFSKKKEMRGVT